MHCKFELVLKIIDDSTSDSQLNQGEVDYEFESNEVPDPLSVVDDQFVPKVGMTLPPLKMNYTKAAGFSIRVRSTNRKGNEIKNQLITRSREGKWKSKISLTEKTNPTAGCWCLDHFKGCVDHSHPCYPSKAEMLKQHRELSMSIRRTIENNEEVGIRPAKLTNHLLRLPGMCTLIKSLGKFKRNSEKRLTNSALGYSVYEVGEQVSSSIFNKFVVTYDSIAA
ncbi:hypothetical protein Ahy_A04g021159 [Arachis hypogaea]|uniref:FAR1 domain-containing protein n=1 Tax=Arachis hypogaea TaxID=3818 RepID=A0A445DJK5_ARAHY|nr:hypothetical protein Ahy_A04g021159 [Arachis hypogaea]